MCFAENAVKVRCKSVTFTLITIIFLVACCSAVQYRSKEGVIKKMKFNAAVKG